MVVDLKIGEHQPAARLIEAEGLLVSQAMSIELPRSSHIIRLETDMCDADDWWTLRSSCFGLSSTNLTVDSNQQ